MSQYSMKLFNLDDVQFFKDLMVRAVELDIKLMRPARRMKEDMIFQISQCKQKEIENLLDKNHVKNFTVTSVTTPSRRSLQSVQDEKEDEVFKLPAEKFDFDIITRRYLWSKEINLYLEKVVEYIAKKNPNIEVKINVEGSSFQKRPIKSITIAYKGKSNPIMVIDAGIHAREWHARSLALYTIKGLMQEAILDQSGLIFKATFIIVPEVNPDGYLYSRKVVSCKFLFNHFILNF
jgi:murein tripeptide amidase MpaA